MLNFMVHSSKSSHIMHLMHPLDQAEVSHLLQNQSCISVSMPTFEPESYKCRHRGRDD